MSLADAALNKVKAQVAHRRLRLDDFFKDCDRLHSGRLTASQFARVLTLNHIALSEEELAALATAFRASAPGNSLDKAASTRAAAASHTMEVGYNAFLAALRQPMTAADTITATTAAATAAGGGARTSPLTQQEEDLLRPSVQLLRHAIRNRGLDIVPPFRDMDPLHSGLVTAAQFERCLPMFERLTPAAVKLFVKKYGDGKGNVAYMPWCREVDDTLRVQAPATTTTTTTTTATAAAATEAQAASGKNVFGSFGVGTYANPSLSAAELVRILREQCAMYRLRCDDFMTDFDRHRTGTVSAAQFESALGRLKLVKFTLTQENITTLVAAYAKDAQGSSSLADAAIRVDYPSFLFNINPKNFDATSEIDLSQTAGPAAATTNPNTMTATATTVSRNAATSYYAAAHAPDTFLTEVSEKEEAERILANVTRLVRANRIFLSPVLRDFDRVRKAIYEHRTCTSSRFARGLATQNLILPPNELRVLIKKYTVPSVDGSPSDDVNYYQFVQDVDPSQAQLSVEQQQQHAQTQARAGVVGGGTGSTGGLGLLASAAAGRASVTVERPATPLDVILQKIALQCEERELRMGDFFLDFDPLRSGTLLPSHFISALTISGVTDLSAEELNTLVSAFPSPKARGNVDAHAFLREMGAYAPLAVPSASLTGNAMTGRLGSRGGAGSGRVNATVASVSTAASLREAAHVSLSNEEQAALARLLTRLRHDVASHNALLTPFFADFDRFGRGKITQTNFKQALARHKFALGQEDITLLCKVYAAPAPQYLSSSSTSSGTGNKNTSGGNIGSASAVNPLGSEALIEFRRFVRDISDEAADNYLTVAMAAKAEGTTSGGGVTAAAASAMNGGSSVPEADAPVTVEEALAHVCCFLQERRPRLGEFFPDGDELRHGAVTRARFRHCLNILGLGLSEAELRSLEEGFAMPSAAIATHAPDELKEVDYPGFVATVRELLEAGLGASAVHERRRGETTGLYQSMKEKTASATTATATQAEILLQVALDKVRRALATRRTTALPAFREYDRTRRGFVKEGQFFACLVAVLGVPLTPLEASVITKAFSLGNGEMGYIRFSDEVDSAEFAAVS